LTIAFIDDYWCYDNEIDDAEFYNNPAEITTVTPDDVTGDAATLVKQKNAETMQRLQGFYDRNMCSRLYMDPKRICIRHLIERLDDCHRELSNLLEKGSFELNHSTHFLTRTTGLPEIRKDVRTMTNEHFQTTATIAAFLSGVTATIMQFTYQLTATPLQNAVNSLLFSSLLFSLMSVINSLLFIKWYQSGRYVRSTFCCPLCLHL
jgi:predicted ribosome quality control (RQC) complex YloA/Tae2 family protein